MSDINDIRDEILCILEDDRENGRIGTEPIDPIMAVVERYAEERYEAGADMADYYRGVNGD